MSNAKIKKMILALLFISLFVPACFSVEVKSDPNNIFRIGEYKDIEILVPGLGFLYSEYGKPAIPGYIDRIAKNKEDFETKYVRIKVSDIKQLKTNTRVAFQLYVIDPNDILTSEPTKSSFRFYELLYFKSGIVTYTYASLHFESYQSDINSVKEFSKGISSRFFEANTHGTQFPLTGLFAPDMNLGNRANNISFFDGSIGIVSEGSFKIASSDSYKINVVFFKRANQEEQKDKSKIKYFSKNDKKINETEQPESVQVLILGKEAQTWSNDNKDWLWQEMERTDADGNVIMRCKQIKIK